jgi:L-ascorbate metabolism protein UlaG (beta-lactamase superfamily)
MEGIKADVAILPVGGTYTMNAAEAAAAADKIAPKLAIPIHFGNIVGDLSDAEEFKKLCHCPVEILPVER